MVYICTNDCDYRDNKLVRGPICYQNAPLPIRESGTFDTIVYIGYFVISQLPEQKIPTLTWHPAPEFSDPVYQELVLKSVANDMAMLPQRMADSAVLKNWKKKECAEARESWWRIFFGEVDSASVFVGKPDTPPDPSWRPRFEGIFKTSCAEILGSGLSREELLRKFTPQGTLKNPLPEMNIYRN